MLAEQRRSMILETLKAKATGVSVVELGKLLEVSTMTIRRDLDMLESQHQVRRIHGGAIVLQEDTGEPFLLRSTTASREKASIGTLAASLSSTPLCVSRTSNSAFVSPPIWTVLAIPGQPG